MKKYYLKFKLALLALGILSFGQMNAQTVSSFPYNEDFESFSNCPANCNSPCTLTNGWSNEQAGGDAGEWTVDDNGTSSSSTGPSTDFNPGSNTGKYIYFETSYPCYSNVTAIMYSPPLDLTLLSAFSMDFAYHMYGSTMGSLSVDISTDNGVTWTTGVWSLSGDQGNMWHEATIDLSAYVSNTIIVRFSGTSTTSFTSDMAIDDISFYEPIAFNPAISSVSNPIQSCDLNDSIVAVITQVGYDTLFSTDVVYAINGAVMDTVSWSDTLLSGESTSLFLGNYVFNVGDSLNVYVLNANGSLPVGGFDDDTLYASFADLPPVIVAQNMDLFLDANGMIVVTPAMVAGASYDACGPLDTLYLDLDTLSCMDMGANTVNITAMDMAGQVTNAAIVVNIRDNVAPVFVDVPNDTTIVANAPNCSGILVWDTVGAIDVCNGDANVISNYISGDTLPNGVTTVVHSTTDLSYNINLATFLVTVNSSLSVSGVVTNTTTTGSVDLTVMGAAPFTFDWSDDGTGDMDDSEDISALPNGNYTVQVTDANGCTETLSFEIDALINGISDINKLRKVKMYPNPTSGLFTIDLNGLDNTTIEVTNNLGQTVFKEYTLGNNEYIVDLSHVEKGIYTVRISNENGVAYNSMIVK